MFNQPFLNQRNNQQFIPICNQEELLNADLVTIIPEKLIITFFDRGHGIFPKVGQFIRFKQNAYLHKSMHLLSSESIQTVFGRGKLIPAIQICLSFLKEGSVVRIWTCSDLAYSQSKIQNIPQNSDLIFELQIHRISVYPYSLSTEKNIFQFLDEIIKQSYQGDQYIKKKKYQLALSSYQSSVGKILSSKCEDIKKKISVIKESDSQDLSDKLNLFEEQKKNKDILKLLLICDSICCKYLQLCLSVGQYLKVLKIATKIRKESRLENNLRVLAALICAYIKLEEFQLAYVFFQKLKKNQSSNNEVIEKIEIILKQQTIKYKALIKKIPSKNSIEQKKSQIKEQYSHYNQNNEKQFFGEQGYFQKEK